MMSSATSTALTSLCKKIQSPAFTRSIHLARPARSMLVTGEKVQRNLTKAEAFAVDMSIMFKNARQWPRMTEQELYMHWRQCTSPDDFRVALWLTLSFYNYGRLVDHYEMATRLVALAMRLGHYEEALAVVSLFNRFLAIPPESSIVYSLMSHFLQAKNPYKVRTILELCREHWQMPLEAGGYSLGIQAMLTVEKDALKEALLIWEDAKKLGVLLPLQTHLMVAEFAMTQYEAAGEGVSEESQGLVSTACDVMAHALDFHGYKFNRGHVTPAVGGSALPLRASVVVGWIRWRLNGADKASTPLSNKRSELKGEGWASDLLGAVADSNKCIKSSIGEQYPRAFFKSLEAAADDDAIKVQEALRKRLGRFYPKDAPPAAPAK